MTGMKPQKRTLDAHLQSLSDHIMKTEI